MRTFWVIAASAIISLAVLAINGRPSAARLRTEGEPYGPTIPIGLVQLFGQGALLTAGVYVGRRWVRLKL